MAAGTKRYLGFGIVALWFGALLFMGPAFVSGTSISPGAGVVAGSATSALQTTGNASLTSIDGKLPALGDALTVASVPVNIASDQTVPVSGTFWQATQPVSAAALPLPAGAATEATLSTVNTSVGTLTTLLGVSTPAGTNTVITPNDATVLACSAVWVGTGGAVYVRGLNDAACVGFLAVPDGSLLPVRAIRVCATGPTTATNMVCLAP